MESKDFEHRQPEAQRRSEPPAAQDDAKGDDTER